MKKILCILLLFCAINLRADLTPQEVQKLYATLPLEARDIYNQKKVLPFEQEVLLNKFFRVAEKIKKLTSAKINFTPKLEGWTKLVFEKIYNSKHNPQIPLKIELPLKKLYQASAFLPQRHELKFTFTQSFLRIVFFYFSILLTISVLPIHEIKFRLFIQRE